MLLCCVKTIGEAFTIYKEALKAVYEPNEVEAITLLAITELTQLSKASVKAFPEKELEPAQADQLQSILPRLQMGEPLQYILGHTEFYGLDFKVNSSVLIPRPETEELVEWVLESVGSSKLAAGSILDIGTGSGCIAISLQKNLPRAEVSAMDISAAALEIAKQNAELNNVRVNFIEQDILAYYSPLTTHYSPLTTHHSLLTTHHSLLTTHHSPLTTPYNIIVSNPPYVTLQDKTQMHRNVIDFEPHTALFVPESDPLIFYKAIATYAQNNLPPNGLLFFEINESYGVETAEILAAMGFHNVELRKDLIGRDRMIKAVKP